MRIAALLYSLIFGLSSTAFGQVATNQGPITLAELNRRHVIGQLGLPLGTAVEINAEVVAGRSLRRGKGFDWLYLLKVTHLNGKELTTPQVMHFTVPFSSPPLANNVFALYEMKHGTEAGGLDSAQIAELERGYVGKTMQLVVYEVGSFHGVPKNLPRDIMVWQGVGFHFC